jgi:hypothetical protein
MYLGNFVIPMPRIEMSGCFGLSYCDLMDDSWVWERALALGLIFSRLQSAVIHMRRSLRRGAVNKCALGCGLAKKRGTRIMRPPHQSTRIR